MDEEERQMKNYKKMKNSNKMNEKRQQQEQKTPPWWFSHAKYHRLEFLTFRFKKMITEMLSVLPLYLILFFTW